MRTNIEIDDRLLAEAMAATGLKTKRKVVEAGLRLRARHKRQVDANELFGCIRWEGDLHRERLDEPDGPARHAPGRRSSRLCSLAGSEPDLAGNG
jgi:Arc/MetJ family transcription regulator